MRAALSLVLALGSLVPVSGSASGAAERSAPAMTIPAHTAPKVASRGRVPGSEGPREISPSPRLWGRPRHLQCSCYLATGRRTASGVWPEPGMAASNLFRFGTRLRVQGFGIVTVTDRSAPGATDVDLFFTSRSACLKFGRRTLRVSSHYG